MYFRKKTSGGRAYLQIVESRRDGSQVRQQVIATLGRYDELRESGQLERLLRSGARFAAQAMVLDGVHDGSAATVDVRRVGPAQTRVYAGTRRIPERPAPPVCRRLRSGGGSMARGLSDRGGR
jgi:hypothetical protein